jgi:hypothetical protein
MGNTLPTGIISIVLIILQGCAMTNGTTPHTLQKTLTDIPAANPVLDHYIAWIPLEKAQTAGVARALTHISLGNAREQAAKELCGDTRIIKQPVTGSVGPVQALAPASAGGYPAWYYRISQPPGLHGCSRTDSHSFHQAVQASLPAWINIRTAANQPE